MSFSLVHCVRFDIFWEIVRPEIATRIVKTFDSRIRDSEFIEKDSTSRNRTVLGSL